jgi:hypothetical protein
MKLFIILYIALGLVLALAVGIEYECEGQEMFPTYYGSPFIFKQQSLGSSMEYFYSVSGLIANIGFWSLIIYFVSAGIQRLIVKSRSAQIIKISYKVIVALMIAYTTLTIAVNYIMLGGGFREGRNYWYMDLNKEAKDWGMDCGGEWKILIK